jgi:hypothetical protein
MAQDNTIHGSSSGGYPHDVEPQSHIQHPQDQGYIGQTNADRTAYARAQGQANLPPAFQSPAREKAKVRFGNSAVGTVAAGLSGAAGTVASFAEAGAKGLASTMTTALNNLEKVQSTPNVVAEEGFLKGTIATASRVAGGAGAAKYLAFAGAALGGGYALWNGYKGFTARRQAKSEEQAHAQFTGAAPYGYPQAPVVVNVLPAPHRYNAPTTAPQNQDGGDYEMPQWQQPNPTR